MKGVNGEVSMDALLKRIRACRNCEAHLSHSPRPVVQAAPAARILIMGQAPGARVHESGVPWLDVSGTLLRQWLGMDEATFYNPNKVALVPMGFCYPGKGKSGDLPPRPECAPLWHPHLMKELPLIQLTVLIGQYAQKHGLGARAKPTLTETVRAFSDYLPDVLPSPHPSPRNRHWLVKNPWVEREVLPELARRVTGIFSDSQQ
jgi:uracil-DNA glycosylase